jgi:hypothetical protein
MSLVKRGSGDEATCFRQAVYIDWTIKKHIPDSCGGQQGYSCVISCFVENLVLDNNCRYKTVKGNVESINTLFKLRGFAIPIDFSDKQNMCTRLIDEIEREETIAKQRSPLTKEMFVNMGKLAAISRKKLANLILHDWFCLIRICGFRVAEYAQTTQIKIDMHQYSSGKEVTKAFLPGDWIFKNNKGQIIRDHPLDGTAETPKQLKITFRIQKNCQNGQSITIILDDDHPEIAWSNR